MITVEKEFYNDGDLKLFANSKRSFSASNILQLINGGPNLYEIDEILDPENGDILVESSDDVCVKGIITSLEIGFTKKGDEYARGEITNELSTIDFVVYPKSYSLLRNSIQRGAIGVFCGSIQALEGYWTLSIHETRTKFNLVFVDCN